MYIILYLFVIKSIYMAIGATLILKLENSVILFIALLLFWILSSQDCVGTFLLPFLFCTF